ncbi:MAG: amino acid permease [Bacteroidales bacterium]|nr:amino acid permease [Bacteroidales bacterium]
MRNYLFRTKSLNEIIQDTDEKGLFNSGLKRNLTVTDLTALGIAAIVGAGIFSTIGNAAAEGGPAISLLFVFTAVACGFSALCYAEFASLVPVSGSAYTYAYYAFGELIAWIIGWDLLLEYAIGNIAVAISWSEYFTSFVQGFGWHIPEFLTTDYFSAARAFHSVQHAVNPAAALHSLTSMQMEGYRAWITAPSIGPIKFIADIPALFIVFVITVIVFVGIKESKRAGNLMVGLKLLVIFLVIVAGSFYISPKNWSPFAPNGIAGVLKGVSAVFFAFIGFDAISTTAEECKNPSRDLPRAIFYALAICIVLYVMIALVLTGMINYKQLGVGDPLSFVFHKVGLNWISGVVAAAAIFAMASVMLVFQIGQPRIWMSMSRDGLLPKAFSRIHPKFLTPSFATIVTGFFVGIPCLFTNLKEVTDLTSIGTLFAFILVSAGILVIDKKEIPEGRFKVPYINGRYLLPAIFLIIIFINYKYEPAYWQSFFDLSSKGGPLLDKIPMFIFIFSFLAIVVVTYLKHLSLIPILGVVTCLFLMTELGYTNWLRFVIWLIIGLVIYFSYGRKKSRLNIAVGEEKMALRN